VSEVSPNDVCDIVPGTGRRSIRRQDDGLPVLGLLPSVASNVVEPGVNTTYGDQAIVLASRSNEGQPCRTRMAQLRSIRGR
jgi:hypothetical protein